MNTKIWLGCILFVAVTGFAAEAGEPQVIHLDGGTKLTFLGLTTGTDQMAPGYENLRTANRIYTPNNPTMLWIKSVPPTDYDYQIVVSDQANTADVNLEKSTSSYVGNGVAIYGFILTAFPRWDKEFVVRVRPYMGEISKEEFVIPNPAPVVDITNWITEPLPATKSDGDLEVTLNKLVAGAPVPHQSGKRPPATFDLVDRCVHLNFDFRVDGQATTNWDAWPVQTTDAAGNWSRGLIYAYPTNGVLQVWGPMHDGSNIPRPEHYGMDGCFYEPGLWPDHPWKVRLEFIQHSGFSDDELVTFTNVPVKAGSKQDWEDEWNAWDAVKPNHPPVIPDSTLFTPQTPQLDDAGTNFPFTVIRATVKDVHLKLLPPLLVPNENSPGNPKEVSVIIGAGSNFNPKGMNLTVVSATDDQGRELWHPFGIPWAGHYSMEFQNVHEDIKSVNLTLALHKGRFVEFTVAPGKQ